MRRTLKLLYGEGLVNRLPYVDLDTPYGNKTFAYGLTDAGIRAHLQIDGELRPKPFTEHSQRTLDHELEISFFHIELKKLCAEKKLKLYWQQKDLKCTVNPDAYFAITDPAKSEGKNTYHYFLEIERAKIRAFKNGEPQIMRKLGKYYDYYNTTGCEKEWNFKTFRVIVVQRTEPEAGISPLTARGEIQAPDVLAHDGGGLQEGYRRWDIQNPERLHRFKLFLPYLAKAALSWEPRKCYAAVL